MDSKSFELVAVLQKYKKVALKNSMNFDRVKTILY